MTLDKNTYRKLILNCILLNSIWALLSTQIANLIAKGMDLFIIGFGFLLIYSLTFFLTFEQKKRNTYNYLMFTTILIAIFIAATFVVPFFTFIFQNKFFQFIGLVCTSIFPVLCIITILNKYVEIQNKKQTIIIAASVIFISYLLIYGLSNLVGSGTDWFEKILHPMALGFCCWQILTTLIIGKSISYRN
jgi:hypothetical protein